ncbi:hypothetical protein H4219_005220 [Mycoemilia scoparia]|uniref:Polysaccharide biosynthesis domain-containing protein n=1 Tax=Mycoemilia scoparia TaxID=417184 RepID=A0A9W8DQI1_9FUNG|nr:hypothetical protein H4219_005220 [Mycoemilia scoparia]
MSLKAEDMGNMPEIEKQWAVVAMHHAETYYKILQAMDGKNLKLTKIDDEIYEHFKKMFPEIDVTELNEKDFKTPEAKARWRPFINEYENKVKDFNYGTLLRIRADGDYTEDNTMFATRTQFYCIEISRNKLGYNSPICQKK